MGSTVTLLLDVSEQLLLPLPSEYYHDRFSWFGNQILEVHGIVDLLLCFDCLIEAKVVMPILDCIKGDVPEERS